MDNNKIIICVLVAIVIVLLVALVAIIPHASKQNTNLTFENGQELNEGDSIQIKLTDSNGTAIANQTVNVTITDENRTSDYHSIVTDENGVGTLKFDKGAGEYNVTISYGGNDGYNSCNANQKITIKEKVAETKSTSSTINGPEVDGHGVTREQVEQAGGDVKYDAKSGVYVQYDSKYGLYHD